MSTSFIDKFLLLMANGTSVSTSARSSQYHDAAAIGIISPPSLEADTYTIEVNTEDDESGDWATLKDRDGNDTFVPAASQAAWYPELSSFPAFRIQKAGGNVAADREFTVIKAHTV